MKPVIDIQICMTSDQPLGSGSEVFNIIAFDINGKWIDELEESHKLAFQAIDYVDLLRNDYLVNSIVWLDVKGNRINV